MNRPHAPSAVTDGRIAAGPSGEQHEQQNALFLWLARTTGKFEHVLALESLFERLGPVQRLESLLLDSLEAESNEIAAAIHEQDSKALRHCLARYHRRRMRIVPELLERLSDQPAATIR